MNVGEICTRDVVVADQASSLQQAAALMREHHVGALVVIGRADEGTQVLGVVTDRDIVIEAVSRGVDVVRSGIGPLASGKLAALPASATLGEAIAMMKDRGVRRLLVSGGGGELHGVVSLDDLLAALGHEMAQLAHAMHKGRERESAERQPLRTDPPLGQLRIPVT